MVDIVLILTILLAPSCPNGVCIGNDEVIVDQDGTKFTINSLTSAIYRAEGGKHARKPFGILSVTCEGYDDCRRICINTVRNNIRRFIAQSGQSKDGEYLRFLANRYCPVGAGNDPQGLNKNWLKNVKSILKENAL